MATQIIDPDVGGASSDQTLDDGATATLIMRKGPSSTHGASRVIVQAKDSDDVYHPLLSIEGNVTVVQIHGPLVWRAVARGAGLDVEVAAAE